MSIEKMFSGLNQSGSLTVTVLVLLPLLLTIAVVVGASLYILQNDAEIKHQCRTALLASQQRNERTLNELLSLNPGAKALRAEYQIAMAAATAARDPYSIAITQAELRRVHLLQLAYSMRQKALILRAKTESLKGPEEARSSAIQKLKVSARIQSDQESRPRSTIRHGSFPLTAQPAQSLTPDYQPTDRFSELQTAQAHLRVSFSDLLPQWMNHWIRFDDLELNTRCSATIEKTPDKGGIKWNAKLKADNWS
jgi:hypothetical protein